MKPQKESQPLLSSPLAILERSDGFGDTRIRTLFIDRTVLGPLPKGAPPVEEHATCEQVTRSALDHILAKS